MNPWPAPSKISFEALINEPSQERAGLEPYILEKYNRMIRTHNILIEKFYEIEWESSEQNPGKKTYYIYRSLAGLFYLCRRNYDGTLANIYVP